MNLNSLIQLLQNKLSILQTARGQAYSIGDLNQLNSIDKEILETQNTMTQLGTLANIAQAASSVNSTLADVAVSGINAIQNPAPVVQGPSASAVINGYDVSAYATDPLYEGKIRSILSTMPIFSIVGDIDRYIQAFASGSPVTGDMVYKASQQYGVDLPLMMAIMQNDSAFGTLGIGASTFNPGNIGNTGTSTQSYPSWNDGVTAVANWLNNHRVLTPTTPDPTTTTPVTDPTTTDATTTPATVLPNTPITTATSTATFIIPTVSTTTPFINPATSTPVFINPATSTNSVGSTTATSTSNTTSTTTPDFSLTGGNSTTTDATSTNSTGTTTPSTGTTTPPLDLGNLGRRYRSMEQQQYGHSHRQRGRPCHGS